MRVGNHDERCIPQPLGIRALSRHGCVVVIGREFAVSGLRSIASGRGIVIPASNWGKAKMFTQIAAVSCLILALRHERFELPGRAALWLVVAVAIISGTEYFVRFWKLVTDAEEPAARTENRNFRSTGSRASSARGPR